MSSLHLLATQCEAGVAFSSLLLLVQQHVDEGHFRFPTTAVGANGSQPQSAPAATPQASLPPVPPQSVVPSTAALRDVDCNANPQQRASTKAPPLSSSGVDPLKPAALTTPTSSHIQQQQPPSSTRSVGGFVAPPSPYTAFRKPHMRRPNSATQRVPNREPPPPTLLPSDGSSASLHTTAAAQEAGIGAGAHREARRLEYVDRWLEKLYFRNPVVVSTKTRPQSPMSCHARPPSNAPQFTDNGGTSPHHQEHEEETGPEETVVAMLPPKPVSRNPAVWREVLEERLVSCFSVAQQAGEEAHLQQRPPLRASSARPGSATSNRRGVSPTPEKPNYPHHQIKNNDHNEETNGNGLPPVDVSLPNVSKFVARKRMMAS